MTKGLSDVYEFLDLVDDDIKEFTKGKDLRMSLGKNFYEEQALKLHTCLGGRYAMRSLSIKVNDLLKRLSKVNVSITADEWNRWYDVGTEVLYIDDEGNSEYTKTSSIAWDAPGDVHVVGLEGKTGGFHLSNIFPVSAFSGDEECSGMETKKKTPPRFRDSKCCVTCDHGKPLYDSLVSCEKFEVETRGENICDCYKNKGEENE